MWNKVLLFHSSFLLLLVKWYRYVGDSCLVSNLQCGRRFARLPVSTSVFCRAVRYESFPWRVMWDNEQNENGNFCNSFWYGSFFLRVINLSLSTLFFILFPASNKNFLGAPELRRSPQNLKKLPRDGILFIFNGFCDNVTVIRFEASIHVL